MGYTHHWAHTRRFTNADWLEIKTDLAHMVTLAEERGVRIGDLGGGVAATIPMVDKEGEHGEFIGWNGVGEDAHETFMIWQKRRPLDEWQKPSERGSDFCKTARKDYDVTVTAALIYLESRFPDQFTASSDGRLGRDTWEAGMELARAAWPRLHNALQFPRDVRWDSLFDAYHWGGGNLAIVTLVTGELALADHKAYKVLGTFPEGEVYDWVLDVLRHAKEKRQAMLPCRCDTLDRWQARQMRTFRQAAESFGYLAAPPSAATLEATPSA